VPGAQRAQLDHELAVIARLGFSGFFLVMWDAVRFARTRGILCQGRGSSANSAVAYALGITAVDPVANSLLFERFLSAARTDGLTEAPDIDLDVEHDRREELLDYVYGRWRRERAAITCVVQQYSAPPPCRTRCAPSGTRRAGRPRLEAAALRSRRGGRAARGRAGARIRARRWRRPRGRALLRTGGGVRRAPALRSTHPGGFVLSAGPLGEHCRWSPRRWGAR
jgi:error-prone DNA polymerase